MLLKKNIPYVLVTFIAFVLLRLWYKQATTESVLFLLSPVSKCIAWLTGSEYIYDTSKGFIFRQIGIYIDKSCSGFNFMLITFLMLTIVMIQNIKTNTGKWLMLPAMLLVSIPLTIFADTARILTTVFFLKTTNLHASFSRMHQSEGVFVYLFLLICFYFLAIKSYKILKIHA